MLPERLQHYRKDNKFYQQGRDNPDKLHVKIARYIWSDCMESSYKYGAGSSRNKWVIVPVMAAGRFIIHESRLYPET
jgi:hypothetical protein